METIIFRAWVIIDEILVLHRAAKARYAVGLDDLELGEEFESKARNIIDELARHRKLTARRLLRVVELLIKAGGTSIPISELFHPLAVEAVQTILAGAAGQQLEQHKAEFGVLLEQLLLPTQEPAPLEAELSQADWAKIVPLISPDLLLRYFHDRLAQWVISQEHSSSAPWRLSQGCAQAANGGDIGLKKCSRQMYESLFELVWDHGANWKIDAWKRGPDSWISFFFERTNTESISIDRQILYACWDAVATYHWHADSPGMFRAKVLCAALDVELANTLLKRFHPTVSILNYIAEFYAPLMIRLSKLAPVAIVDCLKTVWSENFCFDSRRGRASDLFDSASRAIASSPMLNILGYESALLLQKSGVEPSVDSIKSALDKERMFCCASLDVLVPFTTLWFYILLYHEYQREQYKRKLEIDGLQSRILELATNQPAVWVEALEWLVLKMHELGMLVEMVTVEVTFTHKEIIPDISAIMRQGRTQEIRDRAHGLMLLIDGVEGAGVHQAWRLVSFASRLIDGVPLLPHPLNRLSCTWFCSVDLENTVRYQIARALKRFEEEVHINGRSEEENLTTALLKELEFAFRDSEITLSALRTESTSPILSVLKMQNRTIPKAEENTWGCDVAILVTANIPGAVMFENAELIQVKKSEQLYYPQEPRGLHADSWRIDIEQLNDILKFSQTAAYWLVGAHGDILVVPARIIHAILKGQGRLSNQKKASISYSVLRSAAIPLEQYLVDLVVGTWVGTSLPQTLKFARGEDANTKPRNMVHIKVTYARAGEYPGEDRGE